YRQRLGNDRSMVTAASEMTSVWPDDAGVYRVARRNGTVFAPADWRYCGEGRFDDPGQPDIAAALGRFRTIYCATTTDGALGESLGTKGVSVARIANHLPAETDDSEPLTDSLPGTYDAMDPLRSLISRERRTSRHVGHTSLDPSLRC